MTLFLGLKKQKIVIFEEQVSIFLRFFLQKSLLYLYLRKEIITYFIHIINLIKNFTL